LRNELRAKSGIMRGREFVMKDMYSLHASQEDMDTYYDKVIEAYKKIYNRLGIGEDTYITFASGGAFTKFSHEFQTICEAGEDVLYINADKSIAVNEEVLDDATQEIGIDKKTLSPVVSAETGNIFKFGTEKSEKMNIVYKDAEGNAKPIYLASYGIGVTRAMGVIVEKFADEKGLVWPAAIAPFSLHLISLAKDKESETAKKAEELYKKLTAAHVEVLFDDRDEGAGSKFADSDLIGIPMRVVISDKSIAAGGVEIKERKSETSEIITIEQLLKTYTPNCN